MRRDLVVFLAAGLGCASGNAAARLVSGCGDGCCRDTCWAVGQLRAGDVMGGMFLARLRGPSTGWKHLAPSAGTLAPGDIQEVK